MVAPSAGSVPIMPKHVLEPIFKAGNFASAYNVSTAARADRHAADRGASSSSRPARRRCSSRNPYWFGFDSQQHRLPYLDELVFLVVPDQDTADLKFRSGQIDGLDNVKPENYQWYADNQQQGNYTLYDLGPALNTNFFWFNLNTAQTADNGRKVGDPYVEPAKYRWFNNPVFRRAVSMAVDREAMIPSIFFGDAVKNWSTATPGSKLWYTPDIVKYDFNLDESKRLLASLGWKDENGDGVLEDAQGQTGQLLDEDEQRQQDARRDGEFHPRRPREGRHQGDARAGGLQHAHHEHPRRQAVRHDPARAAIGVPPDPAHGPERLALQRTDALLEHQPAEAGDAARRRGSTA